MKTTLTPVIQDITVFQTLDLLSQTLCIKTSVWWVDINRGHP